MMFQSDGSLCTQEAIFIILSGSFDVDDGSSKHLHWVKLNKGLYIPNGEKWKNFFAGASVLSWLDYFDESDYFRIITNLFSLSIFNRT